MNGQTQKKYDYETVKNFTKTGGEMDGVLVSLQDKLKELKQLVTECEDLYHGKGQTSPVYQQYQYLYANIGNEKQGLWQQVYAAAKLQNYMYTNAEYDYEHDNA